MTIFLPVAGCCLSLSLLLGLGASIGLVSGLFGVGGGFLLTPALMMIGVPATVAVASGSCQMVATSSSGVAAHFRLGNVDAKIGSLLLLGSLAGAAVGVQAIKDLRAIGEANLAITLTYVVVLGILGSYMFVQSLGTLRRGAMLTKSAATPKADGLLRRLPWQMEFPHSRVRHSILLPLLLALLVGILATIMGVGGGFVMLPMMIYLLGMPAHVAVGTSLFQIVFSSAGITYMQAATNHTVDLILVLPLAASSAVGAQIGARLSRLLRGSQLIILLAILVLLVTGKMTMGLILTPSNLLRPSETGPHPRLTRHVPAATRSTVTLDGNSMHDERETRLPVRHLYKVDDRRRLLLGEQDNGAWPQSGEFPSSVERQVTTPDMGTKAAQPFRRAFSANIDECRYQPAEVALGFRCNGPPGAHLHRQQSDAGMDESGMFKRAAPAVPVVAPNVADSKLLARAFLSQPSAALRSHRTGWIVRLLAPDVECAGVLERRS